MTTLKIRKCVVCGEWAPLENTMEAEIGKAPGREIYGRVCLFCARKFVPAPTTCSGAATPAVPWTYDKADVPFHVYPCSCEVCTLREKEANEKRENLPPTL